MKKKGFSLLETLIVLGLSLLVLLAAFEFFGITRSLFFKLKEAQEKNQAIQAALVKLRIDLLRAGFGLEVPLRAGVVQGIDVTGASLLILSREEAFALSEDATSGEIRISLKRVSGLSPGRRVCLADEERAELHTIALLEGTTVVLSAPLEESYLSAITRLLLLEEVSYFLDDRSGILRRKVNASPAQPLLDDAGLFVPVYRREDNLVRVSLAGKAHQEKTHELSVFPKNLGLVHP
ncbi:MAG: prepilin-type N-terminal cleavage/methylation domain-containing protein [Candidatus Aminicenantales bacterium]